MTRQRLVLTALAAVLVFVVAIVLGRSVVSSPSRTPTDASVPTDSTAVAPAAPVVPDGFVTFNDVRNGFSIAYPGTWARLQPKDDAVRLLVAQGTRRSLLIRAERSPVDQTVTTQTLGIVRGLTDRLVQADQRVKVLGEPEPITLDGVPGYRYRYTFASGPNGKRGAHVHYFLFRSDRRLITMVFQVPSAAALRRDSGLLDRIAGTFHTGAH